MPEVEVRMDDAAERFLLLLHEFEEITQEISARRAHAEFDQVTLQLFWQRWPEFSSWAGSLWRLLSEELTVPASPHLDPDLDELGESG
jgi:hypothetical protein